MNIRTTLGILAISLCINFGFAQDFQGVATYKSKRKMEIQLDSTQISSDMQQRMMEMMKKQFEKSFLLSFNKEESIYKEEEKLSPQSPVGVEVVMINTGGADILYKNTKSKSYTNQSDVFGKIFLIKDKYEETEWKLESDTKNIGDYTCFKATTTREIEIRGERGVSINGDKELDDDTVTKETITITAWYTPQIPISNGPGMYQGLPGLILEANDGRETIICSKIVLNPEESVNIEEPTKGKEVNQKDFNKIMEDKMKEMNERYNSDRDHGDGIEIKIRG